MKFYKVFKVEKGGELVSAFEGQFNLKKRHTYKEREVTVDRKPEGEFCPGLMFLYPLEGALNFLYLSRKIAEREGTHEKFLLHEVVPQSKFKFDSSILQEAYGGRYSWEEGYTNSLLVGKCII